MTAQPPDGYGRVETAPSIFQKILDLQNNTPTMPLEN